MVILCLLISALLVRLMPSVLVMPSSADDWLRLALVAVPLRQAFRSTSNVLHFVILKILRKVFIGKWGLV